MPKGELRPERNVDFSSATPSPSASRKSVMRLGLGTPAPMSHSTTFFGISPRPRLPSGFFGVLLSATSTSPFGRT
jgi:hypothetical protein